MKRFFLTAGKIGHKNNIAGVINFFLINLLLAGDTNRSGVCEF